jgi:amidase
MTIFDRRRFILGSTAAGLGLMLGKIPTVEAAFEIEEATIASLQAAMKTGQVTAQHLVTVYMSRINSGDKQTNSIVEINPEALLIARNLDAEQKAGKLRGPLHGIPVVIKDNIDTADKMKTTAGSLALMEAPVPKSDAFLVTQLRNAGAIILAKTNLSEWANFRSTSSTSGWSGRGGQTRNPYILDRNPCGSSSGTGAAIAANFATIGIGTETDGSIVCPSSICGIVGVKPTIGLVSRSGVIPIAASQDTAGPMTRTVADAAVMLNVLDAADPADPATTAAGKRREKVDYTNSLKLDGLKGAVIGVARDYWGKRAEVDKLMDASLEVLKAGGATLVDVKFTGLEKFGDAEFEVLKFEFKDGLEKYLAGRGSQYKTLDDLIKFNNDNAAREMSHFKQEIFESSAKKGPLTSKEYLDARALSLKYTRDEIDALMNQHKLDAIVAPSNAPTWMTDLVNGDCGSNYISSSSLAAISGYPSVTVPAGFIKELPIGISFIGRAYGEHDLIRFAYAFEQATKARRKPKFLATVV